MKPQGTLAESIRAGGAGYRPSLPAPEWARSSPRARRSARSTIEVHAGDGFDRRIALVHAWKGDTEGNLVYRKTARNFNPMMATAGRLTVAEVEHLVEPGEIDGDHIVTPAFTFSATFTSQTP